MNPIITSLLDMDFYKFTMGQFAFLRYPKIRVKYAFKNRTKGIRLARAIDLEAIREQLNHVRTLRPTKSELHYLRGTNEYQDRMFVEPYLEFFANLQMSDFQLYADKEGNIVLEFEGNWSEVIYWETLALSIINELYFQSLMKNASRFQKETLFSEGKIRLARKISLLKQHPLITFTDFGTRRRFSRDWQRYVVEVLAEEMPGQFIGTSNTKLAMDFGLLPMGTSAHELDMVMSGVMHGSDDEIRESHQKMLREWWDLYGQGLSIALTDTYGTDFFFRDFTVDQARQWKGLRQDSGDPIAFGEKAIEYYKGKWANPKEKLLIFSDGLDTETIIKIFKHFHDRIKVSFGWGTNLTNDLRLIALSLVVKVTESNGHGTVKLSDNLAKAMGRPEDVERFKRIFGYTGAEYTECKV